MGSLSWGRDVVDMSWGSKIGWRRARCSKGHMCRRGPHGHMDTMAHPGTPVGMLHLRRLAQLICRARGRQTDSRGRQWEEE